MMGMEFGELVFRGGDVDVMGWFGLAVVLGLTRVTEGAFDVVKLVFAAVVVGGLDVLVTTGDAVALWLLDCAMATIFIPTRG